MAKKRLKSHPSEEWMEKKKFGSAEHPYTLRQLWEADDGICDVCGKPVDPLLKYPHPNSWSIKHVNPSGVAELSTLENVVLTHIDCHVNPHVVSEEVSNGSVDKASSYLVRLPEAKHTRVKAISNASGKSLSQITIEALDMYMSVYNPPDLNLGIVQHLNIMDGVKPNASNQVDQTTLARAVYGNSIQTEALRVSQSAPIQESIAALDQSHYQAVIDILGGTIEGDTNGKED